jgi:hypothetical protein
MFVATLSSNNSDPTPLTTIIPTLDFNVSNRDCIKDTDPPLPTSINAFVAIVGDDVEFAVIFTYSNIIDPVPKSEINVSTTDASYINFTSFPLRLPVVIENKGTDEEDV